MRLKEGGLLCCGPPCSSFVFLNSYTHGRTKTKPFGFAAVRSYVRLANQNLVKLNTVPIYYEIQTQLWMKCELRLYPIHIFESLVAKLRITTRMILLWMVATVRYAFVLAEQPGTSCMLWFPYLLFFKKVLELLNIKRQQTYLSRAQRFCGSILLNFIFHAGCIIPKRCGCIQPHRLSNMGVYGSPTLKPSRLFGSWSGPKRFVITWSPNVHRD